MIGLMPLSASSEFRLMPGIDRLWMPSIKLVDALRMSTSEEVNILILELTCARIVLVLTVPPLLEVQRLESVHFNG